MKRQLTILISLGLIIQACSRNASEYSGAFSKKFIDDRVPFNSEGLQYLSFRLEKPVPNMIFMVRINPGKIKRKLISTLEEDKRLSVSEFALLYNCEVAINASFFEFAESQERSFDPYEYEDSESYLNKSSHTLNYFSWGPTIAQGHSWHAVKNVPIFSDFAGYFSLSKSNKIQISKNLSEQSWSSNELVVTGLPGLIYNGVSVDLSSAPNDREPRSAIGIDDHGNIIMLVVDGRNEGVSAGLTIVELQELFQALGAKNALNLDGGGSSALYVANESGIVNRPSKGRQRIVANHLGICDGKLPIPLNGRKDNG